MAMNCVVNDPYLDTIVEILKPYDPERIILFGSRARGEADELSDYDIIVIKRTERSFLDRLQDMVPYLIQLTRPADILVYTHEEFDRMGEVGLGWVVRQEGVTLYERPSCCSTAVVSTGPGGYGCSADLTVSRAPCRGLFPQSTGGRESAQE